jgi:hypothetical protein
MGRLQFKREISIFKRLAIAGFNSLEAELLGNRSFLLILSIPVTGS